MFSAWMDTLPDEEKYRATGAQQPAMMRAQALEESAMRFRARLGLDPVSRVKIGKALSSRGLDLAKMAAMEYGAEDGQDED